MMEDTFSIIFSIALLFGIILLQIFLSKKENKWVGLILPIICLLFSVISVLSVSTFTSLKTTSVIQGENGQIISEQSITNHAQKPDIGEILATIIPVFIVSNIPTLILLTIYTSCRGKRKKNLELEKMNIQDLE